MTGFDIFCLVVGVTQFVCFLYAYVASPKGRRAGFLFPAGSGLVLLLVTLFTLGKTV